MADGIGGLISGFGQRLQAAGAAGADPAGFFKRQQEQRILEEQALRQQEALGQLQQAFNPPPFIQADIAGGGEAGRNAQNLQRGDILSALSQIDPTKAAQLGLQQQKGPSPLSTIGKQLFDIDRGFVPDEAREALLRRATQPRQPLVSIGKEQTELQKARGKSRGALEDKIDDNAFKASSLSGELDLLETQLAQVDRTGALQPAESFLLNVAQSLGVPLTDKQNKKLTALQLVNSITKNITISGAKRLGSNPSNKDNQLLKDANADLGKSKEANERWIDTQRAKNEYEIGIARIKDESLELPGKQLRERFRNFAKINPITARFQELQAARQTTQPVAPIATVAPVAPTAQGQQEILIFNPQTGLLE